MIEHLARASVDGAVGVALVWLLCRVASRLSPSVKTWLWWCAAAKFVVALMWTAPLQLPVLPAPVVTSAAATSALSPSAAAASSSSSSSASATPLSLLSSLPADVVPAAPSLVGVVSVAVLVLWSVGVLVAAGVGVNRWRRAQQLIRRASSAHADTAMSLAEVAVAMGLRATPRVLVSDDVETPLVVGAVRPVVILPAARFARLSVDEQRMALAHECAHIRRADLRIGAVPALCEVVFFFHPLARFAAREYALWREAACDAAVLDALNTAPADYGRLLLDLGVSHSRIGLAAAGVSGSSTNLKRRLLMLTDTPVVSLRSRLLAVAIVVAAAASIVPVDLTARTPVFPGETRTSHAPTMAPTPTPIVAPLAAPTMAVTAAPVITPAITPAPDQRESPQHFVLIVNDDRHIMSGNDSDVHRAEALRRTGEPLLWFLRDGREFIVRDRAVIDQAIDIWKPVHELGEAQGRLGAEQGALGARQGDIGERQGKLGAEQGKLGERQAEVAEKQAELTLRAMRAKTDADRRDVEMGQQKLEVEVKALGESMDSLGRRMDELGVPMNGLGRQMDVLGRQMDALSRRMTEASTKAEADMSKLIARVVASGAAQPVR